MRTEEFDATVAKLQKDGLNAGEAYAKVKETLLNKLSPDIYGTILLQIELLLDIRQLVKASLNLQASEAVSVRDPKWK